MLSPGLAKAWESLALVETRVMPLSVGLVVSRTTWVLSSVAVTGEPLLPARSSTSMLKEALPFWHPNGSTDFPLLAFGIYLIEFQGIQTADADL